MTLFSLGSPRVGNDIFSHFFKTFIGDSIRLTHRKDIVPTVPPQWLGFHHVAREVWSVDRPPEASPGPGQPAGFDNHVCDDTGEDPHCSDSACLFEICLSVSDHLTYLNVTMDCHPGGPIAQGGKGEGEGPASSHLSPGGKE